jgi:hypothetical protein
MSKSVPSSTMTPKELLGYAVNVMEEHNCLIRFVLDVRVVGGTQSGFMLVCEAREASGETNPAVQYQARIPWPCNTHKTIVGALYWLLLDVDGQLSAGDVLAALAEA